MYNFIVCGIFKNESHILLEWIEHYLSRGVDHIYLVNDNSTDTFIPIIEKYGDKITLFHNDIVSHDVGRQVLIYDKYFRPVLTTSKWAAIIDLDEFMYSPANKSFAELLEKYNTVAQLKVDWLHFGSSGHIYQPSSVVSGFTKRAIFGNDKAYYNYKTIFKCANLRDFSVHGNTVSGITHHIKYNDAEPVDLVINHYSLQSQSFYLNIKCTRGDVNNWYNHAKLTRDVDLFHKYDLNEVDDTRLFEQNKNKFDITPVLGETDNVTLIITSCNRPALLQRTLESFIKQNTYPIAETFLIDDSGIQGCNDSVIEPFKELLNIKNIYNSVNNGQVQSIDKVYSYVRTKWIFHCEEDWCFLQPGFIEKSMKLFHDNPSDIIYTVWLCSH
jgi:glycosyltransferase involved in cell wall biosynthesis